MMVETYTGSAKKVVVSVPGVGGAEALEGENLLRVLERIGALGPPTPFCFEGTCRLCECEVQGGAKELPIRSDAEEGECFLVLNKIHNNKNAYAGQLNSFTHLRAPLVLHDHSIFWPKQQAASGHDPSS
jgi:hypothetical protein